MRKITTVLLLAIAFIVLTASSCDYSENTSAQDDDSALINDQQEQYSIGQPVPVFDWSLERELVIELYRMRNQEVATHSVWRSDYGMIEGDCASMGYGIPYDTSLTNPWVAYTTSYSAYGMVAIGQPEPNGLFASTNTSATWVMCTSVYGGLEPVYVESKVTVYAYPLTVDYDTNRVYRAGDASITIDVER